MSLSYLRSELQKMGLSTDTPGLKGEARGAALQDRLQQAKDKENAPQELEESFEMPVPSPNKQAQHAAMFDSPPQHEPVVVETENLSELGVVEARKRLGVLGIDSSTPGLAGENRRVALIARLLEARGARRASGNAMPEPDNPSLTQQIHSERYNGMFKSNPGIKPPAVRLTSKNAPAGPPKMPPPQHLVAQKRQQDATVNEQRRKSAAAKRDSAVEAEVVRMSARAVGAGAGLGSSRSRLGGGISPPPPSGPPPVHTNPSAGPNARHMQQQQPSSRTNSSSGGGGGGGGRKTSGTPNVREPGSSSSATRNRNGNGPKDRVSLSGMKATAKTLKSQLSGLRKRRQQVLTWRLQGLGLHGGGITTNAATNQRSNLTRDDEKLIGLQQKLSVARERKTQLILIQQGVVSSNSSVDSDAELAAVCEEEGGLCGALAEVIEQMREAAEENPEYGNVAEEAIKLELEGLHKAILAEQDRRKAKSSANTKQGKGGGRGRGRGRGGGGGGGFGRGAGWGRGKGGGKGSGGEGSGDNSNINNSISASARAPSPFNVPPPPAYYSPPDDGETGPQKGAQKAVQKGAQKAVMLRTTSASGSRAHVSTTTTGTSNISMPRPSASAGSMMNGTLDSISTSTSNSNAILRSSASARGSNPNLKSRAANFARNENKNINKSMSARAGSSAGGECPLTEAERWSRQALHLHTTSHDHSAAEVAYKKAIAVDPGHATALGNYGLFLQHVKRDYDGAEGMFRRAIIAAPATVVTHILNFASFQNKIRGAHDEAELLYTQGLALAPTHAGLLGNFAMFLKKVRKDYPKAESMFQRAVQADPTHANNLGSYAGLLKRHGPARYDEAEELYEAATSASASGEGGMPVPVSATVLGNFANFMFQCRGDKKKAKELYGRAVRADPNHPMVSRNYALFLRDCPEMRNSGQQQIITSRSQGGGTAAATAHCTSTPASYGDGNEQQHQVEDGEAPLSARDQQLAGAREAAMTARKALGTGRSYGPYPVRKSGSASARGQ